MTNYILTFAVLLMCISCTSEDSIIGVYENSYDEILEVSYPDQYLLRKNDTVYAGTWHQGASDRVIFSNWKGTNAGTSITLIYNNSCLICCPAQPKENFCIY